MSQKLLLHHCCVVCSPNVLKYFRKNFSEVVGFWFNPNIYPEEELDRRKKALESYAGMFNYQVIFGPFYSQEEWLAEVKSLGIREPERCRFCYQLRLKETAGYARRNGFDCFSTTLLSSPYQKHELVKEIAEEAGQEFEIEFVYQDFRPKFYDGVNQIRELGLYRQKYCGCKFSYEERLVREKMKLGGKQK